jgi:hypothetical protein
LRAKQCRRWVPRTIPRRSCRTCSSSGEVAKMPCCLMLMATCRLVLKAGKLVGQSVS